MLTQYIDCLGKELIIGIIIKYIIKHIQNIEFSMFFLNVSFLLPEQNMGLRDRAVFTRAVLLIICMMLSASMMISLSVISAEAVGFPSIRMLDLIRVCHLSI